MASALANDLVSRCEWYEMRAAEIQGRRVSDFVIVAAQEAAQKTIAQTQIISLSLDDQRALAQAIINPPKPTPALRRAKRAHRRLLKPR
jgi:uncharacterized protein (DUF1778 family)